MSAIEVVGAAARCRVKRAGADLMAAIAPSTKRQEVLARLVDAGYEMMPLKG